MNNLPYIKNSKESIVNYALNLKEKTFKDVLLNDPNITDEDRALSEFTFEANSKNGIKPEQKYTIKVAAINVNGTIIWSDEVTVTTLEKDEPDVAYEKNMSKVAFGFFIENLLNNLKNN